MLWLVGHVQTRDIYIPANLKLRGFCRPRLSEPFASQFINPMVHIMLWVYLKHVFAV